MQLPGRSFAAVINFYHLHFTNGPRNPPQWQTKSHEGSCKVEECRINNGRLYNYHDVGVLLRVCQADIRWAARLAQQDRETMLGSTNQININLKSFQNTLVHLSHSAEWHLRPCIVKREVKPGPFSRCKSFSQQGDSLQHRHWMGCYHTLKGFLSAEEGRCLERQPYWSWLSLSPLSARNIFIFNKVSAESLYENILHECKILHRKCSGCVWFKWHFLSVLKVLCSSSRQQEMWVVS